MTAMAKKRFVFRPNKGILYMILAQMIIALVLTLTLRGIAPHRVPDVLSMFEHILLVCMIGWWLLIGLVRMERPGDTTTQK